MEFSRLGNSGLKVSRIAYGNWLTHGSQIDEDTAAECVAAALDVGITTFDTADVYAGTRAEEVLGRALKGHRRESLEISTKVCLPVGSGPNDRGLSRKHIMESAHGSLRRLGTDYLDIYYAHRFDRDTPLAETLRAFDDLIRQGKVLYIGVSEWTADEIRQALRLADELGLERFVASQPQYSMLWRVIEEEVVPLCEQEGLSQMVWSPVAQGVLSGKYLPGRPAPAGSRAADANGAQWVAGFLRDDVLERVQRLAPLAREAGLTRAQLAIAWTLQNPNVAAAVVGASRPQQVRNNVVAAEATLDADLMKQIDEILDPVVERDPKKTDSAW
ncbi:aldo/keto reductase [Streptomyces agglomeratus]|uniref:Aldo/keto reductase n=1 Tax=Streptomyces agglomeratus TaxID=285458 RepID=A0A1E5P4F2_9ACTN|nr:aldo/keto reductase family protein [Streptomyces agglomeratus]OEJ24409.1 aldo/keto reductase [Streptomyces agglomeratus]OEJ41639.1 aldo/keto reductase [Streptomyces agglomeratus]OEJ43982.1 aldo/keto reductase [Streptomyces agglomeratus]OEJ54130.1 aldo/keto reductase [Streptomyces agglomeratus]OEJ61502.1 aldo/keto reductase [Streptomyces agglomeratus]